jgi:hypothetical protein
MHRTASIINQTISIPRALFGFIVCFAAQRRSQSPLQELTQSAQHTQRRQRQSASGGEKCDI